MSALFKGTPIEDLTDADLSEAAQYAQEAIIKTANHYNLMVAYYETIGEEIARREGSPPKGSTIN